MKKAQILFYLGIGLLWACNGISETMDDQNRGVELLGVYGNGAPAIQGVIPSGALFPETIELSRDPEVIKKNIYEAFAHSDHPLTKEQKQDVLNAILSTVPDSLYRYKSLNIRGK